ncbi:MULTISPECIES: hypothetical protein [Acetobacteraceae]|uniref:hypothetical protein n=1 Tax=Acetobacteraceae TaxID=433 RepID=UPI001317E5C0|nr:MULTISPECIES: hypothetical protein [Acetobacteraceae]QGT74633.1 hypothetical protein GN304_01845 [Bombella sp. ESL0368]
MEEIMKKLGVAFVLASGLLGYSLSARAEENEDQVNQLMQSMKAQDFLKVLDQFYGK